MKNREISEINHYYLYIANYNETSGTKTPPHPLSTWTLECFSDYYRYDLNKDFPCLFITLAKVWCTKISELSKNTFLCNTHEGTTLITIV